jgi:hypothetical protein
MRGLPEVVLSRAAEIQVLASTRYARREGLAILLQTAFLRRMMRMDKTTTNKMAAMTRTKIAVFMDIRSFPAG